MAKDHPRQIPIGKCGHAIKRVKIERRFELVVDHLDRETCLLVCSERLERSTETILFDRDVESVSFRGPLEDRVLDEVRDAVQLVGLVPRTSAQEKPERHRSHARHAVGKNYKSVIETSFVYVFSHQVPVENSRVR